MCSMQEKKPEIKKLTEMIERNTYGKKHKKKHNTGGNSLKPRKRDEEAPIQKMDRLGTSKSQIEKRQTL